MKVVNARVVNLANGGTGIVYLLRARFQLRPPAVASTAALAVDLDLEYTQCSAKALEAMRNLRDTDTELTGADAGGVVVLRPTRALSELLQAETEPKGSEGLGAENRLVQTHIVCLEGPLDAALLLEAVRSAATAARARARCA